MYVDEAIIRPSLTVNADVYYMAKVGSLQGLIYCIPYSLPSLDVEEKLFSQFGKENGSQEISLELTSSYVCIEARSIINSWCNHQRRFSQMCHKSEASSSE